MWNPGTRTSSGNARSPAASSVSRVQTSVLGVITPGSSPRRRAFAARPVAQPASQTKRIPLSRRGTLDDYVGAILFLVSGLSAYVTGTDLLVDGGVVASLLTGTPGSA